MLALNCEKYNRRNETNDESNTKNMVKLPWIPVIGPKTRKELKKTEYKVVLAPTANLNKSKLLQSSYLGLGKLGCNCERQYIGETEKCVLT